MPRTNPLLRDRAVDFVLYEVLDAAALTRLPHFADHGRETFDAYLASCRRAAREVLFPDYRAVDAEPPVLRDGRVQVHPRLRPAWARLKELGVIAASRPAEVGGQQLPLCVATAAALHLMAGNLSAYGYAGLTAGAAHLLEAFGSEEVKAAYMGKLYAGEWTGTMALTEPQAGSSLADVRSRATPRPDGLYDLRGSKIFISGGDHDLAENVVHLMLARLDGAPAGIKGVSLFAVPRLRPEGGALVGNDVQVAGLIHKIGWRGLPSLALEFGAEGGCRGHLVGRPNQGINHMFQMMNEARIMVGCNGVATAAVAYQEALAYALERPQGRPLGERDPARPQVPIVQHADVRRMLLRQKAIVEGGAALVLATARLADLAAHAGGEVERARAALLLDLLTPIAKSFPAEWGFEANALAVQVHGGYGYSSEYLPEAWLRDQKLNSLHEGTTGIQGLDLLGRKAVAGGGAALLHLREEIDAACAAARAAGVEEGWATALEREATRLGEVTLHLAGLGLAGDAEAMLRHSTDYLSAASIVVVGWLWLRLATAARLGLQRGSSDADFYRGELSAAQYWLCAELPRAGYLLELCRANEDSYARLQPDWL